MEIREEDLIFTPEVDSEYLPGDTILANGEDFVISNFIKSKIISDKLGFPVNYSWYKAENKNGDQVNIFLFDEDIDSIEPNDQVAEKWFNSVYNTSESL